MAEGLVIDGLGNTGTAGLVSDVFEYRDGALWAEDCALERIAEEVGTPFYCYARGALEAALREYIDAFQGVDALICYALKANSNQAVIRTFARMGAGADVVSEGELRRALAAGVSADKIVFAGVGKTAGEMAAALDAGILQFNVESESELLLLDSVASQKGVQAPVALRVNPDVDAKTHAKITTGTAENKFGIDIDLAPDLFAMAATLPGIDVQGVAVHIGSQLMSLDPYREAFARVADLVTELRGSNIALSRIDLGGGLGINYEGAHPPAIADYAAIVRDTVEGLGCRLILEPGRRLVGEAGLLVSRVIHVKHGRRKRFVIIDAAMNDLIRPTLYEAYHPIVPVRRDDNSVVSAGDSLPADIVGPICESGDIIANGRGLAPVAQGDLIAVASSGAYGAVMSGTYNTRPLLPEVLVSGAQFAVVRERQSLEALIAADTIPDWL